LANVDVDWSLKENDMTDPAAPPPLDPQPPEIDPAGAPPEIVDPPFPAETPADVPPIDPGDERPYDTPPR
jgi:hypothetical protein